MIDTAETVAFYAVPVLLLLAVAALFSAHIPGLRVLTGAAPLEKDTSTTVDADELRPVLVSLTLHAEGALHAAGAVAAVATGRRLELPASEGGDTRADV